MFKISWIFIAHGNSTVNMYSMKENVWNVQQTVTCKLSLIVADLVKGDEYHSKNTLHMCTIPAAREQQLAQKSVW